MRNSLLILLSFYLIISFCSCESVVEIDIPNKPPKIVVNCFFTSDSVVEVFLSKSQHILSRTPIENINDAKVGLYNESVLIEELTLVENGKYISVHKISSEKEYTIKVSSPGLEDVSATSLVPPVPVIMNLDTSSIKFHGGNYKQLSITVKDNPAGTNYYQLKVSGTYYEYSFAPGSPGSQPDSFLVTNTIYFESEDPVFNHDEVQSGLFSDELFNGKDYTIKIRVGNYFDDGSKLFVTVHHLSKEQYLYLQSLNKHMWSTGDPFSQPVRVYSNIENGFGIFSGFSSKRDSI